MEFTVAHFPRDKTLTGRGTIENVIEQLLKWGSESMHRVSNQPSLPHAVIVLNKCPNDMSAAEWEQEKVTKWLLSALDDSLYTNPKLSSHIASWEDSKPQGFSRGAVKTKDLLSQYYGTISAIRFPGIFDGRGRPKLIV